MWQNPHPCFYVHLAPESWKRLTTPEPEKFISNFIYIFMNLCLCEHKISKYRNQETQCSSDMFLSCLCVLCTICVTPHYTRSGWSWVTAMSKIRYGHQGLTTTISHTNTHTHTLWCTFPELSSHPDTTSQTAIQQTNQPARLEKKNNRREGKINSEVRFEN